MASTTFNAGPFSYSQACDTFGAADCTAARAGLGSARFVDDLENSLPRDRFIGQEVSEHAPANVDYRLGHPCLGELGAVRVTDEYVFEFLGQPRREFVQEVLAPVGHFGVERSHTANFVCSLSTRQLTLDSSIELLCLNLLARGKGRQTFEPEVDADCCLALRRWRIIALTLEVGVPMPAGVLAETASLDGSFNWTREPAAILSPLVGDRVVTQFNAAGLERDPTQRTLTAPAQPALVRLLAPQGVFLADRLNRLRVQTQQTAGAFGQVAEVEAGGPALVPTHRGMLGLVAEIPHRVNGRCKVAEMVSTIGVFDTIGEGLEHCRASASSNPKIIAQCKNYFHTEVPYIPS
jgi:hypothetical protein